jgi:hypothetical protein
VCEECISPDMHENASATNGIPHGMRGCSKESGKLKPLADFDYKLNGELYADCRDCKRKERRRKRAKR